MPPKRKPKASPTPEPPRGRQPDPNAGPWVELVVPSDPASYAASTAVYHNVKLRALKHWVAKLAVAKHGTIAEAARKLGLTRGGLRYLLRTAKRR